MPKTKIEPLAKHLNFLYFSDDLIYYEDGSAGFSFQIIQQYDELFEKFVETTDKLSHFFNSLDTDLEIQFVFKKQNNFKPFIEEHLALNKNENQIIKETFNKRADLVKKEAEDNNLFNFELHLFVKKRYNFENKSVVDFFKSEETIEKEAKKEIEIINKDMNKIQNNMVNFLKRSFLNIKRNYRQDNIDIISSYINQKEIKGINYKTKDDLSTSDLRKGYDNLYFNNNYFKMLSFSKMPEHVFPTIIKYITNGDLRFSYDFTINVRKLDKDVQKEKLRGKRRIVKALKFGNFFSKNEINEDRQVQEENLTALIEDMTARNENLFEVEFFLKIKGETKEIVEERCDKILNGVKQMEGGEIFKESFANFSIFKSAIPGNSLEFNNERHHKLRTSYLIDLIPIYGPPKGLGAPMIPFRTLYGSLAPLDVFNKSFKNLNGIVAGSSGSGKSVVANSIALGSQGEEPIIIIIDKGGSYKKNVELLEGEYFNISPEYSINPFIVSSGDSEIKEMYFQSLLKLMAQIGGKELDKIIVVEDAVEIVLNSNIEKPIISDFVNVIGNMTNIDDEGEIANTGIKIIKNLKSIKKDLIKTYDNSEIMVKKRSEVERHLNRWTKGKKGDFLNQREGNLNITNDIVALDLKGLENFKEALEIVMLWITQICWFKAESNPDRKKLFIFDEVWSLFLHEAGGKLIEEMYRTLRKYNASILSISQSILDFTGNKHSNGILENISFYYLLEQSEGTKFKKIQETLNLNETELDEIKNLKTIKGVNSKVFIKTPEITYIAKLQLSPFEYWVSTTDPDDLKIFYEILENFNYKLIETLHFLEKNIPNGHMTYKQEKNDDIYKKLRKRFNGDLSLGLEFLASRSYVE